MQVIDLTLFLLTGWPGLGDIFIFYLSHVLLKNGDIDCVASLWRTEKIIIWMGQKIKSIHKNTLITHQYFNNIFFCVLAGND